MNMSPEYGSECSSSATLSPLCWTGYDDKLGFFKAEVRDESQFILHATEHCIYSVEAKLDEERSCSIALSDVDDVDLYLLPGVVAPTASSYSIFPYFNYVVQWFSENVNVLSAEELLKRRSLIAYDVLCVVEHRDGTGGVELDGPEGARLGAHCKAVRVRRPLPPGEADGAVPPPLWLRHLLQPRRREAGPAHFRIFERGSDETARRRHPERARTESDERCLVLESRGRHFPVGSQLSDSGGLERDDSGFMPYDVELTRYFSDQCV